ncbi:type I-C CRISPR-associated protein Cas8c/Csd1 [Vibrio sp. OCN044]|uniref:Type I-C CRISPR-associated protein Cas8c/Csd1 n=1 Tax=Vibrio tetraodonis subsp. pristinus TaxID=2695891 RepID=A0A6L8LSQ3_9VIBR|nr:type I-C CRISPR-associated protein Cas8c/Csd1 [Vibrio tetraodonis]MYM58186.1 type I-C CRISPR-associated protein Cas8c/Csd1 [Vibrio tetraodonis subsp. pristinus]
MNLISALANSYEALVEQYPEDIWLVSHVKKQAHIEVAVDLQGRLIPSLTKLLEGNEAKTLIPVTESSANRSGTKIAPHPLCEELSYIAKDLPNLKQKKYDAYMKQLNDWCNSEYSTPKLLAIRSYLEKGTVFKDLSELFELPIKFRNEAGKNTPIKVDKTFIRWAVVAPKILDTSTQSDKEIIESWQGYESRFGSSNFCFITGENTRCATRHPRFLRSSGDGAKIISSNDEDGFTYSGRFTNDMQATGLSYFESQKAHNALRCLIEKQGIKIAQKKKEPLTYLAWATKGQNLLDLFEPDFSDLNSLLEIANNVDHSKDLGRFYAEKLRQYFQGFKVNSQLSDNDQISLVGLDAATKGRMGILYYRETIAKKLLARLEQWQGDLGWQQRIKINEQWQWVYGAPSLYRVLDGVYGDVLKSADTLKKNLITRLYPCIVEGKPIPKDIMESAFHRAINRVAYKSDQTWLWLQNLGIACSLIKGFYTRNNKKEYLMALQQDNTSRDYLFGRLLAVANKVEKVALSKSEANRLTTAERFMTQFVNRPASTWLNISNALVPYQQRLFNNYQGYDNATKALFSQIHSMFKSDDFISNQKLGPEFLLGFHNQMMWLETNKVEKGQWVKEVSAEQTTESQEETV